MKINLTAFRVVAISILLGVSTTFAFAPFEIFPLAIAAPAGLLMLLFNITPRQAFWRGFYFGLGLFGSGVYWVFISINLYGDVPKIIAFFITAGLVAILALFPAYICYVTNRIFPNDNKAKLVYAFPAIWVWFEWLRSIIFGGFPWLFIGYSQTNSPLRGYAPLFSVYGVSFAALLTSGLIASTFQLYRLKKMRSVYLNLFAIGLIWLIGGLLTLIPWTKPASEPVPVSLVQGNIPQSLKWSPDSLQLSIDRYVELTEPLWGKSKIIVWPEAAIPTSMQSVTNLIQKLDDKANASGSNLILGIPMEDQTNGGYFNAVITLGDQQAVYAKRRLVPFGEYIPFQQISARFMDFMKIPLPDLKPGKSFQPPLKINNIKFITSICFEVAFPDLVFSNDRTLGMLVTVTNDAWFGKSTAQAQHLQMAQMRSIELARPSLFVSNNGITAIIDPKGKIIAAAPPYETFVLNGTVQPTVGLTPLMRNGSDPIFYILIALFITAIYLRKIKIGES